jgi:RNA-binding protein YhbY
MNRAAELSGAEKRALRGRAQALKTNNVIGKAGLTDDVVRQIRALFQSTELLKIRLPRELPDSEAVVHALLARVPCQLVDRRGRVVTVFCPKSK